MKKSYVLIGVVAVLVLAAAVVLMYVNPNSNKGQNPASQTTKPPTTENKQPENKPPTTTTTTTTETPKTEQPKTESPKTEPTSPSQPATTQPTKTALKNTGTYVSVGVADPVDSLDPAGVYDSGSGGIIFNIYDTLVFFDGASPEKLVPMLSTKVPTVENGLIKDEGQTYIFPIRTGVKFQWGPVKDSSGKEIPGSGIVTPEDVEYSIERGLLQDKSGGPQSLLLEPLLGVTTLLDLAKQVETQLHQKKPEDIKSMDDVSSEGLQEVCKRVKAVIEVEGQNTVFHLKAPFAAFLQIIAQYWASILDKEWVMTEIKGDKGEVIKKAGWDGSCDTWKKFYDPQTENSELFKVANGTGPYILERWRREEEIALKRNPNYWREPAHLDVNIKFSREWSTRLLLLQNGDADYIVVPPRNRDQVQPLVKAGLVTEYKDLPTNAIEFWVPNEKVNADNNPYIGSGQLDGQGIPPNFFSDVDVRKGFAYAFDWETFINDAINNDGVRSKTMFRSDVFGYNPQIPYYSLNLEKASEHLKKAWGGQLWEKGFKLVIPYVAGGTVVKLSGEILQKNLASINPKFKIEVRDFQSTQLTQDMNADKIPFDYSAWSEDFHDPHNWAYPCFGSTGYYGRLLDIEPELQKKLDELIQKGRGELDPAKRKAIYDEIQQINYDQALYIPLDEPTVHRFMRSWMKGYTYNPTLPGTYLYYLGKE
ncbi:ABC transporter substrate-binding protein [Candidatus Acetothermia bacterium]|nr:ABC transporter substrate-binding protein [Candidatus Acetothermia bacterium]